MQVKSVVIFKWKSSYMSFWSWIQRFMW